MPENDGMTMRRRNASRWWLSALLALLASVLVGNLPPGSALAVDGPISFSSIPLQSWTVNGEGRAVLKVGDVVYVGGTFNRAESPDGGQSEGRFNLAAFDARTGDLLPDFRADTDGRVTDLVTDGVSIFVSGSFSFIGGFERNRVAAIHPTTGAVRPGFRAETNSTVYDMSIAAGKLYLGGVFTNINGISRSKIGAVDLTTGAVDQGFAPQANGTVRAIAASPDGATVFVGGTYSQINGVDDTDISVLDGLTGALTGLALQGVTGYVDDLDVTPDGRFLLAGHSGIPGVGNRTAVYDTSSGARQWRQSVDGDVQSVHLIGDMVYAGFHDGALGDAASRVAGYTLDRGVQDLGFRPSFDRFMGAFAVNGDADALVIAGNFSVVSGVQAEGFAIFPSGPPTSITAAKWGNESWQYLDDGSDQGVAWREPGFDDTGWSTGVGEFGYGNGGERTKLSYGPTWSDKHITTYFRTRFETVGFPESAAIYMRVDDGAVVYVNGVEAARDNLAGGLVTSETLAADRSGNAEGSSRYFPIDPALLVPGTNTLAVELHQSSPSSDDLKFFATFVGYGETDANWAPTASFDVDQVVGVAPLPVAFDGNTSSDINGSIVDWVWDFGDGAIATGSTTTHTYGEPGVYPVTLTVTDDGGAVDSTSRSVTVTAPLAPGLVVDVAPTAQWSYLDTGANLADEWTQLDAAAENWSVGVGEFGYGDGDENTVVSFGPNPGRKFTTTYFRTLFIASAQPAELTLSLRVDDGAVAYLNGVEITRFNLPPGAISSATLATDAISGSGEREDRLFLVDPALIQVGPNVLSVEIHQNTRGSSDKTFFASLVGTGVVEPPVNQSPVAVATASPMAAATSVPVAFDGSGSSDVDGSVVAWAWDFGDGLTAVGETVPHAFAVAGAYTVSLTVTDDLGATGSTTLGVTVTDPQPPDGPTVDVAPTALWSYSDQGDVVGAGWADPGYDDAGWAVGVGEFGYGDGDEATVVSFGPSAGQKYRTTYFRTNFSSTGIPKDLTLTLRVDDGAVVYLNGVEATRFNLPDGPISYATGAPAAIYGSGERLDRLVTLDPSLIVAGQNVLAVEVHQNSLGSSDLTFLASLVGNGDENDPEPPGPVVELDAAAQWAYFDQGDVTAADWAAATFDDSAWAVGVGEFGYGDGDENTVVSYGPSAGQKFRTTYFRSAFTASAVPSALELQLRVDDGAVVYINGVEAARFNLPDGPIFYGTSAPAAMSGSGERLDRPFVLDPSLVVAGNNVIAVEVHQNTLGSSDLSFLATLDGAA